MIKPRENRLLTNDELRAIAQEVFTDGLSDEREQELCDVLTDDLMRRCELMRELEESAERVRAQKKRKGS